jgi:hypothetical protein
MNTTALVRLQHIDLLPPKSVPKDRRQAEKDRKFARSDARYDVIQNGLIMSVVGFLTAAFGILTIAGALGSFALSIAMFGVALTAACASVTRYLSGTFVQSLREFRLAAPSPQLLLHAEAEQALSDSAVQLNDCILDWNVAAVVADQNDVGESMRAGLAATRRRLASRREEFGDRLERFRLATGLQPKRLPSPH